jgi:hypothetical protein
LVAFIVLGRADLVVHLILSGLGRDQTTEPIRSVWPRGARDKLLSHMRLMSTSLGYFLQPLSGGAKIWSS